MGKISYDDKLRMQTLREQGLGGRAIITKYPHKGWKLVTVNAICKRIDQTGSAVQRKPGSGRPATARTADTIEKVDELICSQDGESGTHRSTREIAAELNISVPYCQTRSSAQIVSSCSGTGDQCGWSVHERYCVASTFAVANRSSQTRRTFILIHPSATRTTVCGLVDLKETLTHADCWLNVKSSHHMLWCQQESALVEKVDFSLRKRLRSTQRIMWKSCYHYLSTTANSCCHLVSYYNKIALQLTQPV